MRHPAACGIPSLSLLQQRDGYIYKSLDAAHAAVVPPVWLSKRSKHAMCCVCVCAFCVWSSIASVCLCPKYVCVWIRCVCQMCVISSSMGWFAPPWVHDNPHAAMFLASIRFASDVCKQLCLEKKRGCIKSKSAHALSHHYLKQTGLAHTWAVIAAV